MTAPQTPATADGGWTVEHGARQVNAPFFPPADADPVPFGRAGSYSRVLADFAAFEREFFQNRPAATETTDAEYEARPWGKPESQWRPM